MPPRIGVTSTPLRLPAIFIRADTVAVCLPPTSMVAAQADGLATTVGDWYDEQFDGSVQEVVASGAREDKEGSQIQGLGRRGPGQ